MFSRILSSALLGLEAELVEVESDIGGGELGKFTIVGLPDLAVSESRERVRSAIKNSGFDFPKLKVTINLAPADLKKHGPSYDLAIAVSILLLGKKLPISEEFKNSLFLGELALDGRLRPINGVLPAAMMAVKRGLGKIFVPEANAEEASLVKGLEVIPIRDLRQLAEYLSGRLRIESCLTREFDFSSDAYPFDLSHIQGQEQVKRALEIAAAGAHNMLMFGPPGSGKTMVARAMPSILPDLSFAEALEITKIYSVAGELKNGRSLMLTRPFRFPHHTASSASLVGGGAWPKPGEISLAHRGVLFLDEFGEFPRHILENLRQPIEDGVVNISRAAGSLSFPAKFILLAAMNPCSCGFYGDPEKACSCSPSQILNYKKRISGPILDRIDLQVEVPRLKFDKLTGVERGEESALVKKRVEKARKIQKERLAGNTCLTNSEMSSELVKTFCCLDKKSEELIKNAVDKMHLSARTYFRILKLARTIADLEETESINFNHLAEALQYRTRSE